MKAVNINGIITVYNSVPSVLKTSTGSYLNAPAMSDEALKDAGCFDLIIDENYDERIHNLGEVYWDTEETVFKKDISNKTWSKTLSQLKEQAIANYKNRIGNELAKTDWYVIRSIDNGTEVPTDISEARENLRVQSQNVESEINAITTKAGVITYDFPNI